MVLDAVLDPDDDSQAGGTQPLTTPVTDAEGAETRPEDSVARSETEVITFSAIIDNPEMTREQRIEALLNLDPAALQSPSGARGMPSAQQPQPAARPREHTPSRHEVAAARRRVPIVMYSTSWCGVCKRARAYFERERVDFVEYDVDLNARARVEYLRLNPRRSVPTIKVGEQVIVGFSEESFEQALDSAVEARLN